jgi:hypothetical protein
MASISLFEESPMRARNWSIIVAALAGSFFLGWFLSGKQAQGEPGDKTVDPATGAAGPAEAAPKGWTKGKGWGPFGKDDEIGALNGMTLASMRAALGLIKTGKVYDLGVNYDAESYKWPGHSPGAIMTYRGPEGVKRQKDFKARPT